MPLFCANYWEHRVSTIMQQYTSQINDVCIGLSVGYNKFYNSLVTKHTNFTGTGPSIQCNTIQYNIQYKKICNAHNVCQLAESAASCLSTRSCRNLYEHLHLAGYSSQKIQCSISNRITASVRSVLQRSGSLSVIM